MSGRGEMRDMEDRKLYRQDVADRLGISIRSLGRVVGLPERDGTDVEGGHARPFWRAKTIEAWLPTRRGQGWRSGQRSGGWPRRGESAE